MTSAREKSDLPEVAWKRANKAASAAQAKEELSPHSPDDALSCAVRTPIQI